MQPYPQPQQHNPWVAVPLGIRLALLVVRGFAVTMEVFLRRDFGLRYIGPQGLMAFLIVPLFALAHKGEVVWPVWFFFGCFTVQVFVARIGSLQHCSIGHLVHANYSGRPLVQRFVPRLGEMTIKCLVEPVLTAAVGAAVFQLNHPLGGFIVIGALCLFVSAQVIHGYEERRMRDMADALIEARMLSERLESVRSRWE